MKAPAITTRKGFTLIEILVASTILIVLAATMWEARGWIEAKSVRSEAEQQIKLMEAGLNAYKTESGGILPFGRGDEYSSHVLYKALNRDEDDDGEPDKEDGVTLQPFCPSLSVAKSSKETETTEGIPVRRAKIKVKEGGKQVSKKHFLIYDPWGTPYRYRLGFQTEDENGKAGSGVNPDFDIFSLGPDTKGDGNDNSSEDNKDNVSNVRSWK